VVVEGIVYARSFDSHLRAFEAKTGKLVWDFEAPAQLDTPMVADGVAYAGSMDKYLWALEAKTGKLLWEFQAGKMINSPVVVDGIAYAGSFDKHLRAFEAKTGKLLWQFQGGNVINSPVVVNGVVYAGSWDKHLRAFEAKTGKLLWVFQAENIIDTPVVIDGVAYAGSMDKHLRAFALKDISSGRYAPQISWGTEMQIWSYLIWGKSGLAARQIVEGYALVNVLAQNNLTPDELAGDLDKLAGGESYFAPGSLALDPVRLCPGWLKFPNIKVGERPVRPAIAIYVEAAKKDNFGASAYLQEAQRLAPDLELEKLGFPAAPMPK
jgi:outer membrane protein assembly factor BamB